MKTLTEPSLKGDNEEILERSLRPNNFKEIIGRETEKRSLMMMIESAQKRSKALDHIIFHGPPGLGKTSFAYVMAKEMGVPIHVTNGSVIDKGGDIAAILTSLEENSILFIDEIHRLKHNIEEILYPAMEDCVLDIVIGKGPNAKTLRLDLPQFTIIGATTKLSMLSSPLRDRFGMSFRLDFYNDEELCLLIKQKAEMLRMQIEDDAAEEIARRSRMTARIAIRILKRVRDMAVVNDREVIDLEIVRETLELLGVDSNGLDETDRNIIKNIIYSFDNKPVGLSTLSASVSEEKETIESVYEPFLLRKGFLKRTPKGRVVTQKALNEYSSEIN
jgi:holliday junction DNA helicase RuvB